MAQKLRIIPLGGLGEIGKNMTLFEYGRDILIVDAGLIALPRSTPRRYRYSGLGVNDIPSCLGETMTLTLEQRWERFSLGRELPLDKIEEIGALSRRHGFVFDEFRSIQKPIPEEAFHATQQALHAS